MQQTQPRQRGPEQLAHVSWQDQLLQTYHSVHLISCDLHDNAVRIRTWYIDHDSYRHCFEPRDWIVAGDKWEWEIQLRRLWYDLVDSSQRLRIALVESGTTGWQLLLIQGPAQYSGVLLYSAPRAQDAGRSLELAVSTFRRSTGEHLTRLAGLSQDWDDEQCELYVNTLRVFMRDEVDIQDGAIVRLHMNARSLPPDGPALDLDVSSFMARSPYARPPDEDPHLVPDALIADEHESPEESIGHLTDDGQELPVHAVWHATVLFRVGLGGIHCMRSDDLEIRHRQAAHYLALSRHDLLRLHPVRVAPHDMRDAEWPLLAQVVGEIHPGASSRYVLIDTEFHNHPPSLEPEAVRQCKLIPGRMPRAHILSVLGLTPYCRQIGRCLLWLNHRLVGEEDTTMLFLEHGDYIRIALPPPEECRDLPTRMIALLYHHEFPPEEHQHLASHLPDHVSMEDQMPTGEGSIRSLLFNDDLSSFVQLKIRTRQQRDPGPRVCRIPDDPAEQVAQYYAMMETHQQAVQEWNQMLGRTVLPLGLQDLRALVLQRLVREPQTEIGILTWYLNHRSAWRCNIGRPLALPMELQDWDHAVRAVWRDELDVSMPLQFFLVTPQPYDMEMGIQAHVLVVQPEEFNVAAALVSTYDTGLYDGAVRRFAFLHHDRITLPELVDQADSDRACSVLGAECDAWYGWNQLPATEPWNLRNGNALTLTIQRRMLNVPMDHYGPDADHALFNSGEEHLNLLQTKRTTLVLSDLLSPTLDVDSGTASGIVWIVAADFDWGVPPFLEVAFPHDANIVISELRCWGYELQAFRFGDHDKYFCARDATLEDEKKHHYLFAHTDVTDVEGTFAHTVQEPLTEFDLMKFLYALGYWRAAIRSQRSLAASLTLVTFEDVQGDLSPPVQVPRSQTPWPSRQPQRAPGKATDRLCHLSSSTPTCKVALRRSVQEVVRLLRSAGQILQTDISALDLPSHTTEAIAACEHFDDFDRYVIYTDGSSRGSRHQVPDRADDPASAVDTWSFVVLGERYGTDVAGPKLTFLGWTAQSVLYQEEKSHYVGAERIGSEVAEREAMIWALLWRLGVDDLRPTVIRPDSITTGRQATGEFGVAKPDLSFRCLRGAYQALAALMPDGDIIVDHTRGHSNEPWNDLVDAAAKQEGRRSMYLPRQAIDMREWHEDIPHLWAYLDQRGGLPPLSPDGFNAVAPDLPMTADPSTVTDAGVNCHGIRFSLSLATGNVNSLYTAPTGHGGKVAYLRSQMQELNLNLVGFQETRSQAGTSASEGILRLSSGAFNSLYGIELWVNLHQPIAYFEQKPLYIKETQIVVVLAEPQILLTHFVLDRFSFWVLVAHAPHTGRSVDDREAWWKHLETQLVRYKDHSPLFCLFDANATAGLTDGQQIFDLYDEPNSNTALFREFLSQHGLCLPATSSDIHTGPQTTWTSPDGHCDKRLDHVAVPGEFLAWCSHSCVLEDMDLGLAHDHRAVALDMQWTQYHDTCGQVATGGKRIPDYDRGSVKRIPPAAWTDHTIASWQTDIGTHVASFNEQLHISLSADCQRPPAQGKKPFMTAELWQLRTLKLTTKKNLGNVHRAHCRGLLRACFHGWSTGRSRPEDDLVQHRRRTDCLLLRWHCALHVHATRLRHQLRASRQQHVAECVQNLPVAASASEILQSIKHHTGPINPNKRKQKALPMVREEDGTVCATPAAALQRWIQFFAAMEGGQELTDTDFQQYWRNNLSRFAKDMLDVPLSELPSLLDLEAACRRVKRGKATGPGLPGELLHDHPTHMARLLYPQLLKLALHGQEALEHKIGFLTMAWKRKGDQSLCSSYRSLLVSSHAGKCIHRALRLHQSDLYERYLQRQQLGGRRRVPVTMCMHVARSFLRNCCRAQKNAGVIFLDLQEAFYRVVRPLVTDTVTDDETLARMAHRLHMEPDALHELHASMRAPNATEQAGLSDVQRCYIAALHTDTGFRLRGQSTSCRTQIGSRPGDCFADIVFGYAWARLLRKFEMELTRLRLIEDIDDMVHWNPFRSGDVVGQIPFLGPTWMDDLCVCIQADSALALESKASTATGLLIDLCHGHAMSPNLNRGKSEVILSLHGKGSKKVRLKYFGGQSDGQLHALGETQVYSINVVGEYLHLGNIIHHSGRGGHEIRRRLAIGFQSLTQHRKLIYHNTSLSLQRRFEIFDTLVLTKVLYGSETWAITQPKDIDNFHVSIVRLYRRLLGMRHDAHMTDDEILTSGPFLTPVELLRRQRLRYMATLYNCADLVPWSLLWDDQHWREEIQHDLKWMYQQIGGTSSLPDPAENYAPWATMMQQHPGYWKRLIRRACQHAVQQRALTQQVRDFHQQAFDILLREGDLDYALTRTQERASDQYFGCMQCGVRCRNLAGERVHMCRSHGQVAEHRLWFDGTQCPECQKEFHTHGRLSQHLRHTKRCQDALRGRNLPCVPAPGHGSAVNAEQERSHNGVKVVQRGAGAPNQPVLPREFQDIDMEFYDVIGVRLLDTPYDLLESSLRHEVPKHAMPWTRFVATLRAFAVAYTDEDEATCGVSRAQIQALIVALSSPTSWPMFCTNMTRRTKPWTLEDYEGWAQVLCARAQTRPIWLPDTSIPRAFTKERVFLHFFSGRRRPGDLQYFLEKFAQPGIILHVVSLDIVIDAKLGDLSLPQTRSFWLGAMAEGWVIAMLAGPPCNTWSKARAHQVAQSHRQPRPVRAADQLWGLDCLSLRELRDVCMGNLLLCFSLLSMLQLSICGGAGVLEHPAEPADETMPSIWRLALVHLLLRLPGFSRLPVVQGLFGSQSPKPTELLVVNMPTLVHDLHQWRLVSVPPKTTSIGKHETGQYATARLKEYPPSFCGGLAQGFRRMIESAPLAPDLESAQYKSFLAVCTSLYIYGQNWVRPVSWKRLCLMNLWREFTQRPRYLPLCACWKKKYGPYIIIYIYITIYIYIYVL